MRSNTCALLHHHFYTHSFSRMRNSMMSLGSFLLFIVLSFCLCSISTSHASSSSSSSSMSVNYTVNRHLCPIEQSLSLLHFKQSLFSFNNGSNYYDCEDWLGSGYYPKLVSWNKSTDCCKWDGVTCNRFTGDVIGLELSCSKLKGVLESNSTLFHLPQLQRFNLAYNDFGGSHIPHEIGRFASTLTHLNLSHSGFEGEIPSEICILPKLVSLDLSFNFDYSVNSKLRLERHVLNKLLQNSSQLRELSLADVNLSSSVLPTYLNIYSSSLRYLDLRGTGLSGNLPDNFFSLPNLREVHLSWNYALTGSLPKEVNSRSIRRTPLEWLDLSFTSLSGEIPHSIGHLTSLNYLDLKSTYLSGEIPNSIGNLTSLNYLGLSETSLSGEIPDSIGNLTSLHHLSLSSTFLSGEIPYSIGHLTSLNYLDLKYTYLSGEIPYSIGNLTSLNYLDLSGTSLSGEIPDSIGNLASLHYLGLSETSLSGELPDSIGNLTSLNSLDLSHTSLSGEIPDSIGNLTSLNYLGLSETSLSGEIPDSIGNLTSLHHLSLSSTFLSGEIPYSIGHLTSLNYLDLSNCNLLGPIPKSLSKLTRLTRLRLNSNRLNGTLPSQLFAHLPSLTHIHLSNNMLSGNIPSAFPSSLEELYLDQNQLVGPVPQSLFLQLLNLTTLDLSFNNFTTGGGGGGGIWELETLFSNLTKLQHLGLSYSGLSVVASSNVTVHYVNPDFGVLLLASCKLSVFPEFLRAMKYLQTLDLSNNEIHGHIPDWAGEIGGGNNLYQLNLSYNSITGLPQLLQWDGLGYLYLKSNLIRGPFPPSFCNMSYLQILDMSNNSFGGALPQCFGGMLGNSLSMADLRNNLFNGTIPGIYRDCTNLQGLIFHRNLLQGEVPRSLAKCRSLELLDLGVNSLNGAFPNWLEDLPVLQVLVLNSNKLGGSITSSSMIELPFPKLRILDLSGNEFVGYLPEKYFIYFKAMRDIEMNDSQSIYMNMNGSQSIYMNNPYSITVVMKGVELLLVKILIGYTMVDLSNNMLQGEIPDAIGSLHSLKALNLSHNNLTGQIPHALGNLAAIESLDLSWNQIRGEIPKELADINSLSTLNLSQNHLTGRIPQGTQFSTFETAFLGNPGLCGFPLPTNCNSNDEPPLSPVLEEDDPDIASGFTWQVVVLGYVCGTLVGLVMGYLMFLTGRPKWFNAAVEREEQRIRRRQKKKRKYVFIGR